MTDFLIVTTYPQPPHVLWRRQIVCRAPDAPGIVLDEIEEALREPKRGQ